MVGCPLNLKREALTCQNQKTHNCREKKKRGHSLDQEETIRNKPKADLCRDLKGD